MIDKDTLKKILEEAGVEASKANRCLDIAEELSERRDDMFNVQPTANILWANPDIVTHELVTKEYLQSHGYNKVEETSQPILRVGGE